MNELDNDDLVRAGLFALLLAGCRRLYHRRPRVRELLYERSGVVAQRRAGAVMLASASEPLVRDVLLRDGSTLRLQAPTPVDFDDIKAFYDGLSPESRRLRFHGFGRTDTVARADAEAAGGDRVALISRHDGRVVAVASYDGLREPGVAEVAFAVADDDQRRGITMRMLEQLAEIAADAGSTASTPR